MGAVANPRVPSPDNRKIPVQQEEVARMVKLVVKGRLVR